jgi:ABC-type uncharacterized transport system YnjBCD substrate-binding protein
MKEITKKSLQNLWDYCKEAYDEAEQANKFFAQIDVLLGKGDVDFDLVMNFVRANKIKRATIGSRAKTVTSPVKSLKRPHSTFMPASGCGEPENCATQARKNMRGSSGSCGGGYSTPGC